MAYIMSGKLSQLSHVQTKSCSFLVSNFSGQWLDKRPVWETLSKNDLDGCKYRGTGSLHFLRLVSGAWTRVRHLTFNQRRTRDSGYRILDTSDSGIQDTNNGRTLEKEGETYRSSGGAAAAENWRIQDKEVTDRQDRPGWIKTGLLLWVSSETGVHQTGWWSHLRNTKTAETKDEAE